MPVGCGRRNAGPARGLGESEAGRAFLRDQFQRRADQRFAQVAVMVAAWAVMPGPAHVNGLYMTLRGASTTWWRPACWMHARGALQRAHAVRPAPHSQRQSAAARRRLVVELEYFRRADPVLDADRSPRALYSAAHHQGRG